MKTSITLLASVTLLIPLAARLFPKDPKPRRHAATMQTNVQAILEIFKLIEERDPRKPDTARELELVDPSVEMNWPASLPYGGTTRGFVPKNDAPTWGRTWTPLQPGPAERKMNPRVVAANDHEVVVLYHQRGLSPAGERYDGEVLGLYEFRAAKLTRAQMFYFDEAGAVQFLARATAR